ncbi:Zinc/cadmium resistance protein [Tolypocladium capitatum]|uniref:Zinc/cadmium resistance protein n=1 Tax=Tolypocladium capitatum TaxID=45235 RepID=A0A2K3QMJ8_9HYPO|nr:Zinc/cadmium resistance protein [Tolypocladium capitatum]
MACVKVTRKQRLIATIAISFSFFVVELVAGFYTHSLALVADAFHYLSDLVGFVVALVALVVRMASALQLSDLSLKNHQVSERPQPPPKEYTFGWQRATLLGAFFNGVFLLALGVSILVQAIERFTHITPLENPKVVLTIGCVGLGLNVLVMSFLHEHDHGRGHGHDHSHGHKHSHETDSEDESAIEMGGKKAEARPAASHHEHKHTSAAPSHPGRDLGMLGVLVHVIGDAINNVGVIIAALVIWKAEGEGRYYIDPAVGVFIAIMIFLTAMPLTKSSGGILLQIAPCGIDLEDVKHDIESIPGVESVHELHIWRLDQHKSIASAHIVVGGMTISKFTDKAKIIMECLHAYGIHSATLQPEILPPYETPASSAQLQGESAAPRRRRDRSHCQLICGNLCGGMRCCAPVQMK